METTQENISALQIRSSMPTKLQALKRKKTSLTIFIDVWFEVFVFRFRIDERYVKFSHKLFYGNISKKDNQLKHKQIPVIRHAMFLTSS